MQLILQLAAPSLQAANQWDIYKHDRGVEISATDH